MSRIRLDYDDRALRRNLRSFDRRLDENVRAVTARRAAITQGDLRTAARWTDRTGAARSGLFAIPNYGPGFAEIFMTYSVNYGIWLEVAHDRKYAVIGPMMRIAGDALMKDLDNLITYMKAQK